uniref:C2H2-type domain-containing protein n=1 Tax=Ananas comosus var. bracteatus TaxID=296719 RepID=A0A6V7NGN6_ANACO|nr:unnamed protein product [Ananas comosus var. bracteatus]
MHSIIMEQTKYNWMWARRQLSEGPLLGSSIQRIATPSSYHESWEEQAFEKDSIGHLGGYTWPPRSYSCSFCRREFRSAQALGGHMNVHRRDRARLKQLSSSPSSIEDQENNQQDRQNTCTPLGHAHQVSSLPYSTPSNPNCGAVASLISSRVSEDSDPTLVSPPSYSSSLIKENTKEQLLPAEQSLSDPAQVVMLELNLGRENSKQREANFCRKLRDKSRDEEEIISSKRRCIDAIFPLVMKSSPGEQQNIRSQVLKISPGPVGELDLELRLGSHPKAK